MNITAERTDVLNQSVDLLVIGVYAGQSPSGLLATIDGLLDSPLKAMTSHGEFAAKLLETTIVHTLGKIKARKVLFIGLGDYSEFSQDSLRKVAGRSAQAAIGAKVKTLAFVAPSTPFSPFSAAQTIAEGLSVGGWKFAGYHQKPADEDPLTSVVVVGLGDDTAVQEGLEFGIQVANAQNLTRKLGWEPSNKMYPEVLAQAAVDAGQAHGFTVEVFDEHKLKELGMGAILGVGQGSAHPPRMVVMRYHGGGQRTLALVGKGITFDSGGISLKPGAGMEEMKYDMLGASAVLGAMCAIADTKAAVNVVGIMAIAQNMPSGSAYKPGDVLTAFNGKTIEITNTDAEGRVVLADAVSYAAHLGVDWIVETSTLTGAAIIVLGHEASALVSTDDPLATLVLQASEEVGEKVWRLPAYPEYKKLYRSAIADMLNSPGRAAGTITAGMIIAEFAGDVPFAHLDIAGTAWTKPGPLNRVGKDHVAPTGVMVRTFTRLAHILAE